MRPSMALALALVACGPLPCHHDALTPAGRVTADHCAHQDNANGLAVLEPSCYVRPPVLGETVIVGGKEYRITRFEAWGGAHPRWRIDRQSERGDSGMVVRGLDDACIGVIVTAGAGHTTFAALDAVQGRFDQCDDTSWPWP